MKQASRSTVLRRALSAYVSDRSRIRSLTQREADGADLNGPTGAQASPAVGDESARLSIVIPDTLDFGRSAGTWRDRSDG